MSEFTSGIWTHDTKTGSVKSGRFTICNVHGATEYNYEANAKECASNARLIASAPEMYELLIAVSKTGMTNGRKTLKEAARKLLARIDGEEVSDG